MIGRDHWRLKSAVRRLLAKLGYDIRRARGRFGESPYFDARALAANGRRPVVVDAGAHFGETIDRVRGIIGDSIIHAFEPSPASFSELSRRTAGTLDLHLNPLALGSEAGTRELLEREDSVMSSFLDAPGAGPVVERTPVEVRTLDTYCAELGVAHIDLLKTDTQGYDLEVLRGAEGLLGDRRVHMVLTEVHFSDDYEGGPGLGEIYTFMADRGFSLVSFYAIHRTGALARWTDMLFLNPEFRPGGGSGARA